MVMAQSLSTWEHLAPVDRLGKICECPQRQIQTQEEADQPTEAEEILTHHVGARRRDGPSGGLALMP